MTSATNNRANRNTQAAAFLADHWPSDGRHGYYLALAGGLLRDRLPEAEVQDIVARLTEATHDDKTAKRLSDVADTARRIRDGEKATGWPDLIRRIGTNGQQIVTQFRRLLGLTINLADLAAYKRLSVEFLAGLGLHDLETGGVGIPYRNAGGATAAVKQRTALRATDGSKWPFGTPLLAYGEDRLAEAATGGSLVLVEGESDCWTLWFHGQHALGLPGADTVMKTLQLGHVAPFKTLYVVEETDVAGKDFVTNTRNRLAQLGWKGQLRVINLGEVKDPSALHCQDPARFAEHWAKVIASAVEVPIEKKKDQLRPPAPYCPFPVEALPEPIRTFVIQGAAALGCDPAYLALPALSVAASLIGNSRVIRLKRNWHEPAVIWSGIVGDSGTLKSPAVSAVLNPLYRLQKRLLKKFKTDFAQYQADLEAYNDRKRKAKKEEKEFTEEPPEKPSLARVVTGDITVEKLAELLEDNSKGLLVGRDELGGWLGSFTRYKGKSGGSDLHNWLEMSRAGTIQVDRKTGDRPTLFITYAAVSITGGIQPGALAHALTPAYMEVGLGARLLMAMPPKLPKRWSEVEIDLDVQEAYENLLDGLRELQMDKGQDGEREPFPVRMTPEAKAVWVRFYGEWAQVQANVEGELAAAFSKLEGYAARLALVHHVVTNVGQREDDCQPVEPASIEAGITLAKWFAYEVRRIYAALGEPEDARQTRRLIEFIRSHGGQMTARRLHLSNKTRYPDREAAEVALDALVKAELADWVETANPKGGRPTRALILKPDTTYFKSYETPDDDDQDDDFGDGDDTTLPPTNPHPPRQNAAEPEGFVAYEACSTTTHPTAQDGSGTEQGDQASGARETVSEYGPENVSSVFSRSTGSGDHSDTPCFKSYKTCEVGDNFLLVTDPADLGLVCAAVEESVLVGVDCETTGVNPRADRIRLLTLNCDTTDSGRFTYILDAFKVDPRPLLELLAEKPVLFHNGLFDLQMLAPFGFEPGAVHDTMLLSQLLHGTRCPKGFHGLEQTVQRELNVTLDKAHQKSDWSGPLTEEQLAYAARDAAVLLPLYRDLMKKVQVTKQERVAEIEARCLPAIAWIARSGVPFDRAGWDALAAEAAVSAKHLGDQLDALAPQRPGHLVVTGAWNWDAPEQVKEIFGLLGINLQATDDNALAAIEHPLAHLIREYRSASKLASTYGGKWVKDAFMDGRLYANWRQLGCLTGRMACGSPNLQNLPGDPRYRRCFRAPDGRILIKADYSQIELRLAAKIANDRAMLDAYARGEDLHTLTARRMLGRDDVSSRDRKLAKPVNFGLIYGLGVSSLRAKAKADYGLDLSEADAERYRRAFFAAYPGIARWHRKIRTTRATETRTLAGRRVQVEANGFFGGKANYAVQGSGGDGMKLALALLWERRRAVPGAFPVLAVHDEIVIECDAGQSEAAGDWLRQAMVDAMAELLAPVPVEVEMKVAQSWAGD